MGHPGRDAALGLKSDILKKRNYGQSDGPQDRTVDDEFKRRLIDASAVAAAATVAAAPQQPTVPVGPSVPQNPPAPGPDRLHKDAPNYVVVSHDHPFGEDPVLNPGYAVVGRASSLKDGYARAAYHASLPSTKGRVVLWIWGGTWDEDLAIINENIDVLGANMPVIHGHLTLTTVTNKCRVEGVECFSPDASPALLVDFSPLDTGGTISDMQIVGCNIHANGNAFLSRRRVYLEGCNVWQDKINDTSLEIATAEFQANPTDTWFSVAKDCIFSCNRKFNPTMGAAYGNAYVGYCIKATAKILFPSVNGGYFAGPFVDGHQNHIMPFSGLLLSSCRMYGSLLCEGWTVIDEDGEQHDGIPCDIARGGVYAIIRGWVLFDNTGSAYGQIPGRVFLDHATVHSTQIARFVNDPAQSVPNMWGGNVWFRHAEHLAKFDTAAPSAFKTISTGIVFGEKSTTGCAAWSDGPTLCSMVDCTTGTDIVAMGFDPKDIMLDPIIV